MKKLSLLLLVTVSFQLVAQSALKTLGEVIAGPIIGLHGKRKKKHHSHKKNKSSSAPTVAPAPNPEMMRIMANNPETEYGRTKIVTNVIAEKQSTEAAMVASITPEAGIPALNPEVKSVELVDSFEFSGTDAFEAHGHLYANQTIGSDDISTTLACQAYQAPQELGYKARATQWLKNSWARVPTFQQMSASYRNACDELQFNAYKHRVAIAAALTVALVAGGSYYWYKNYKAKKTDQN